MAYFFSCNSLYNYLTLARCLMRVCEELTLKLLPTLKSNFLFLTNCLQKYFKNIKNKLTLVWQVSRVVIFFPYCKVHRQVQQITREQASREYYVKRWGGGGGSCDIPRLVTGGYAGVEKWLKTGHVVWVWPLTNLQLWLALVKLLVFLNVQPLICFWHETILLCPF